MSTNPPATSSPSSSEETLRRVQGLSLASAGGGGGNPLLKVLVAALLVTAAVGAYFYFGEKPPVATGEIIHLTAWPIHRSSNDALEANLRAARVEQTFDEMIVIAEVRLHNQSPGPLFLSDLTAIASLSGEEHRSSAASATDFNRVFIAYPELISMKQQPLLRDVTIPAGQTVEGQVIFNYPLTKDQWNLRRSLDVTVSFLHQKDLTISAPQ